MSQSSITSFFNSRKRAATDDIFNAKNKVVVLDQHVAAYQDKVNSSSSAKEKELAASLTPNTGGTFKNVKLLSNKKEVLGNNSYSEAKPKGRSKAVAKLTFETAKLDQSSAETNDRVPENFQNANCSEKSTLVPFKKFGALSPTKRKTSEKCVPITAFMKKQNVNSTPPQSVVRQKSTESEAMARNELRLGDLKNKLKNGSRMAEIRASVARLNKGFEQLKQLENKNKTLKAVSLKEFKSIDVDIPTSPSKHTTLSRRPQLNQKDAEEKLMSPKKDLFMSPRKVVVSPVKSPSKVPAYIKHASLATAATSLPLPHHYRFLGELFRAMETVCSLLYNRKETITFSKLKPSIQEMLKRNFTENHLKQIKHVVSEMYEYGMEKVKSFSATMKKEAYELVLRPILKENEIIMSPTTLLERRREFYNRLLDIVKDHHAAFLLTLDPPMIIAKDKLTRWHPEFDLERIPDVQMSTLPQLPNAETYSTAQDVLTRARELFNCNTRMERALQNLAQAKERGLTEQEQKATGLVNGKRYERVGVDKASGTSELPELLNPALRNLPRALLEKVKAKQAAKALEAMTRSSEDEKKSLVYSRLPDLARTLRGIFVTEKKNVLPMTLVLSKLENSFKSKVPASELENDMKVLSESVPGWLVFHNIRSLVYLKLSRDASIAKVIDKLEALAKKHGVPL